MGRIGAHVSASGGLARAVTRACDLGIDCMQVFVGSPQTWASPRMPDQDVTAFLTAARQSGVHPVFVHAPYLVNPASLRADVRAASARALVEQLRWSDRIAASGVVVHVGSGGEDAFDRAVEGLADVLRRHEGTSSLILENDAGSGNRIGRAFGELGRMIEALDSASRLRVCVDTAHSLAAGYEIRTEEGLAAALAELDSTVGLSRLALVHVNDSKVDLGRNVDRHENLGQGKIGVEALARIVRHPALVDKPLILEVPGYDGEGPDKPNVELLRLLVDGRLEDVPEWRERYLPTAPPPSSPSGRASSDE